MLFPSRYPQLVEDLINSVRCMPSSMLSAGGEPDRCGDNRVTKCHNQLHGFTVAPEEEIDYVARYGEEEGKQMQESADNRRREADVAREASYGEIKNTVEEEGIEALAWYTSFHFATTKKRINPDQKNPVIFKYVDGKKIEGYKYDGEEDIPYNP